MPHRILLVEDNKPISTVLKIRLEQSGNVEVEQAFDLEHGFAMLQFHPLDFFCVILGGQLGQNSTTLSLARMMHRKGLPVKMISFSGNPELQEQQMKNGCVAGFDKLEMEELAVFIETLIPSS